MLKMSIHKKQQLRSKNRFTLRKTTSNGAKKLKVHFIGIGGIGVSALAQYYLAKGHKVSGSDLVSSEITKTLKEKGAKLLIGKHKVENLPKDASLVIYSPAVRKDNPELKAAIYRTPTLPPPSPTKVGAPRPTPIDLLSYPEALGELTKKYFTIAVSGTHGKSTTTAMIGLLLTKAGLDPTVIVGTKLKEFGDSNFRMGGQRSKVKSQKSILVIEADEHVASFLNYWPKIIVLTTIEEDHLDYYKNLNNILKTFKKYVGHLPRNGYLIANKDDENIKKILRTQNVKRSAISTIVENVNRFSLRQREAKRLRRILKIPGEHNVSNALAALTTARVLKISDKISFKALSEYKGSWRRFEIKKGVINGKQITVVSDYAHHPTEIKATLEATKEKYLYPPKFSKGKLRRARKKIWCVFQPHQYQRTFYLFDDFVKVFKTAPVDQLIITDIYDVAGREEKEVKKKVNSEKLIEAINKPWAIYLPQEEIINYLRKNLKGGEVVIIMGAGDIYNLTIHLTELGKKKKIK